MRNYWSGNGFEPAEFLPKASRMVGSAHAICGRRAYWPRAGPVESIKKCGGCPSVSHSHSPLTVVCLRLGLDQDLMVCAVSGHVAASGHA
jgi:hypothetical protein